LRELRRRDMSRPPIHGPNMGCDIERQVISLDAVAADFDLRASMFSYAWSRRAHPPTAACP